MTEKRKAGRPKGSPNKIQKPKVIVPKKDPWKPTKYREEFCQKLLEWAQESPFPSYWHRQMDVARSTVTAWRKRYPEFNDAYEKAQEIGFGDFCQQALWAGTNRTPGDWRLFRYLNAVCFQRRENDTTEEIAGEVAKQLPKFINSNVDDDDNEEEFD